MTYEPLAKSIVELAVTSWHERGMYPKGWSVENQLNGAHAEMAAHILRDGRSGASRWYEAAKRKREELGSDPRQRDGFDMLDSDGVKIDVKFVAHDRRYVVVTPSTHAASEYDAIVIAMFDEHIENVSFARVSRDEFDANAEDWIGPNGPRKRLRVLECTRIDSL